MEGVCNNVLGTLTIAQLAIGLGVPYIMLISTDKAVRPTNVMGANKRLAEIILQALAQICNRTQFAIVRFSNALNSLGSVVSKFRQQIKAGGPITIIHLRMTRYFMTVPEAVQFVIQADSLATPVGNFLAGYG